jgi:hypothetical protein
MDEWMNRWMDDGPWDGANYNTWLHNMQRIAKIFFSVCGGAFALVNIFCLDIGDTLHGYIPEPGL